MAVIELQPTRPVDLARRMVLAVLIAAFTVALAIAMSPIDAKKECKGAFSRAFGPGFDVYHCDAVLRTGRLELRARMPQWMA
jgi:hypothetical protein